MIPERVGINAVFLRPGMGGLETYVRALVPELLRIAPGLRLSIFCERRGLELLQKQPWASEVTLVTHPLLGLSGLKAISELTVLGALASRRVDLLYSVALTAPLRTRAVNVVLIADLTWKVAADPADAITTAVWRAVVPPVARRADRIIALSNSGADDIVRYLRVPHERIDVVPLGPGALARSAATPEPELRTRLALGSGPVILTVANKRVHKNLGRLVESMAIIARQHPDAVLVMPGNPTPYEAKLKRLATELGLHGRVTFPGYVSAADLEGLYACARCFVLASLNEGFGLPVLEAMTRGVPVACARASALPEVAGEAAEYFDPRSVPDIARALLTLLEDRERAAHLEHSGRERAALFSWEATARATLDSWARAYRNASRVRS